jgi:hypothetical protein
MAKKRTANNKTAKKKATKKAVLKKAKKAAPAMDQDAMMAAWQKAMTPSEGHRRLEPMVGTWHAKSTFTMSPGAPPTVHENVSEHRLVLGGRFLEQRYSGTAMGMPFEGIGYTGYDNIQKKYIGTWMDSFGTGLMNSAGVGRPTASAMSFIAEAIEFSGKRAKFECKIKIQDHDHHTYEMWAKAPGGRRYRSMIIEYTRKT